MRLDRRQRRGRDQTTAHSVTIESKQGIVLDVPGSGQRTCAIEESLDLLRLDFRHLNVSANGAAEGLEDPFICVKALAERFTVGNILKSDGVLPRKASTLTSILKSDGVYAWRPLTALSTRAESDL